MSANDGKDVLKALVASAKGDDPSDASMARLDARMAALIAIPAAAAVAGGGAAAASGLGLTAKIVIGTAVVAAVGGGTYVVVKVTREEPAPIVAKAQPDAPPAPPDAAPVVPDATPAPAVDAAPTTIGHGAHTPMTPEERLVWEAKILGQAQDLLKRGEAERALAVLRRLERAARGFDAKLVEERERLLIEAELASGHRAAAVKRAKKFEAAFPRSVQLPRLKELLEGKR